MLLVVDWLCNPGKKAQNRTHAASCMTSYHIALRKSVCVGPRRRRIPAPQPALTPSRAPGVRCDGNAPGHASRSRVLSSASPSTLLRLRGQGGPDPSSQPNQTGRRGAPSQTGEREGKCPDERRVEQNATILAATLACDQKEQGLSWLPLPTTDSSLRLGTSVRGKRDCKGKTREEVLFTLYAGESRQL